VQLTETLPLGQSNGDGTGGCLGLPENLIQQLRTASTAIVSTVLFKRGLRNQVIQGVGPVGGLVLRMIGFAFTLRYIPAREDLNDVSVFLDADHPQRKAIQSWASIP
jgi:hypothetical protein